MIRIIPCVEGEFNPQNELKHFAYCCKVPDDKVNRYLIEGYYLERYREQNGSSYAFLSKKSILTMKSTPSLIKAVSFKHVNIIFRAF